MASVTVEARWVRRIEHGHSDVGAAVLTASQEWLRRPENMMEGSSLNMYQETAEENHLKHDRELAGQRLSELLSTEHWLGDYFSALLSAYDLNGDVDFTTAEKMLATERDEFEKDLAIARRMLRVYPKLFSEESS